MSKKAGISYLYVIGMALTAIGFLMPIMKFPIFGTVNGFGLVGKGDSIIKFAALLVFAGAVAGVIINFLANTSTYKLVALVVSIVGGLYVFFNTSSSITKFAGNHLAAGFFLIIGGWIIAIVSFFSSKK